MIFRESLGKFEIRFSSCRMTQTPPKVQVSMYITLQTIVVMKNVLKDIKNVISCIHCIRQELGKPEQKALVLLDIFKGQTTETIDSILEDNNILYIHVAQSDCNPSICWK